MKNKLIHIPNDVFFSYMTFARANPSIVKPWLMLQKLVIFDFIAPLISSRKCSNILEIGTGLGIHSALLSRYGDTYATELAAPGSFVGADQDVNRAREYIFTTLSHRPIHFTYNDGKHLPYPDGLFDIVFHNSVIEHVPDPVAFNREVARVLKPGGVSICVTGTPTLCYFRFVKDYLIKFPFRLILALTKETVPSSWLHPLIEFVFRTAGINKETVDKVKSRIKPANKRLEDAFQIKTRTTTPECSNVPVSKLSAPIAHFLNSPSYNRIVIEELAHRFNLDVDDLVHCISKYFKNPVHRLIFSITPPTHGQHYYNIKHEMQAWRIKEWIESFHAAGFFVEKVNGYRFHHLLEWTPHPGWNTYLYHFAVPLIRAFMSRSILKPWMASEIIIVAVKQETTNTSQPAETI